LGDEVGDAALDWLRRVGGAGCILCAVHLLGGRLWNAPRLDVADLAVGCRRIGVTGSGSHRLATSRSRARPARPTSRHVDRGPVVGMVAGGEPRGARVTP